MERAIALRIGDGEATLFRDGVRKGLFGAPLREPECDDDVLSSDVEGGEATLVVVGKVGKSVHDPIAVQLKQGGGGEWCVVEYEDGIPKADGMDAYERYADACRRGVQDGIRMVQDGRVTRENFPSFLSACTGILEDPKKGER